MPLLIVAGMPTSVVSRNRYYMPMVDDWNIELIPSRDKRKADLQSCWQKVLEKASVDTEGTHVFAYHYLEEEYPKFNSRMHNRHRLVWMARDTLAYYGTDRYSEMIQKHLDFECRWRNVLRPRGVNAAVLLPESSFSPKGFKEMWSRMRTVHLYRDNLERILSLVRGFRNTHYSVGRWEDDRGLQFKVATARHGSNPPYGHFKFTYHLPEGFHYDVRGTIANRSFTIKDAEGRSHRFRNYTNVDVHGSIRGGS